MCIKKSEAWSVKNARVLLCTTNCPPVQNRKLGSHPVYKEHFSHSDALIINSTFKLLSIPPTPSYWIIFTKTGAYYKAVGSVSLQTRVFISTACQKTFSLQEAFVRTHSGSCNSFIAGSHLWLNSFKACTGMSINLSIWIQINWSFWVPIFSFPVLLYNTEPFRQTVEYFIVKKGFKVSTLNNASSFFLLLWPVGGKMECQLFNHPESKRWTQCNHVRMN